MTSLVKRTAVLFFLFCASVGAQAPPSLPAPAPAPARSTLAFRAEHYDVTATLNPVEQTLTAEAKVIFQVNEASRIVETELHPNLKLSAVKSDAGKDLSFERSDANPLVVRVTLPEPAVAGQKVTLTFDYAGPLANDENSPVKGVTLASISTDGAYLLLPARWFPLTDYPANRYTAVFNLRVPENFAVVGTGHAEAPTIVPAAPAEPSAREKQPASPAAEGAGKIRVEAAAPTPARRLLYAFRNEQPAASGTFVAGNIQLNPVNAEGLKISVYTPVPLAPTANDYGQTAARVVNFFSSMFGPLPDPNLSIAPLPNGTVQSYSAPGLLLVSQRMWTSKVNTRLLAHLAAEQWWGGQVMPTSANDVWVTDGLARYCEGLYVEQTVNKEAFNLALEDFAVGALMYEDAAPISQAGRLEPFTSDYNSVVVNKGAMVFHMLRAELGDPPFMALLREFYAKHEGRSASDADFEKMAEEKNAALAAEKPADSSGAAPVPLNLRAFFAQWLDSTGVPEFKLDYVVYRTQKGFKVVGKVHQDLETFRMPVEVEVKTEGNPEYKTIDVIGTDSEFSIDTFGRPKPGGILLDPHNNLLKSSARLRVRAAIARGESLAEQGRFFDAVQQYQNALDLQKNNSLAFFRMGEAFFFQKNYQAAANSFREALDGDLDPSYKWVEVWSHIYLGKIFDLTGQRERAVNEYSKAQQTNDDTGGAQAEATKYLQQPYKEGSETQPAEKS